jgi:hypothetical protein
LGLLATRYDPTEFLSDKGDVRDIWKFGEASAKDKLRQQQGTILLLTYL